MVQLAIEIGAENVRAAIRKGNQISRVPLGIAGSPFQCPSVGLRIEDGFIFGEAAKMNALARPDEIVFLSDYIQKGAVEKAAMVALINFVCQRVYKIFKVTVVDITFVVPQCLNLPFTRDFFDQCIKESGYNPLSNSDTALSFSISNLNVAKDESVCIIDMRDYPSYAALVFRSSHSYNTLGSIELTDLSIKECENFIEEKTSYLQISDTKMPDNILDDWLQCEISSSLSRYGLAMLLSDEDAFIPIFNTSRNYRIQQSEFQDWISPRIDSSWCQIQSLFQNLCKSSKDISQVVLLGSIFQSEYIRDRFIKNFIGYISKPAITVMSKPEDEWSMCISSLNPGSDITSQTLEL